MADDEKKEMNELEAFIAAHQEFFDRQKRIAEAVEEEMAEIALRKAEHPEMNDLDYQLEVTNRFIEENPDLPHVELKTDDDKK